jgi:tetratricopeptide (TPR) repeat protein
MSAPQPILAVEHVERSSPTTFKLTRLEDGKSLPPVAIASPYEFQVEGRPNSNLVRELRWYLEQFLDYPFHPETDHADHVLDALRAWGSQAFNALFDRRDAGNWLDSSGILQVCADDAHILSWPWEALYDPKAGAYVAHQRPLERRLSRLPGLQPAPNVPNERVNILLVVCRPFEDDVRYRSIARPLIELIQRQNLPAHVDVLRPPTFDQLREHLRQHPGYYHVLHFDGHGAYAPSGYSSPQEVRAHVGYLVFENGSGRDDAKSARDVAALLHEYAVPAVVLNACQSATLDEQAEDAFASVATALLQSGMRSVVATAYSLYVSGAQVFLPEFYRRLFESGSVAEGVRAGRQQMLADKNRMSARGSFPLEDWLLPVLYQQGPLDFGFAKQAKLETRKSRLPREVLEQREACDFIGRDGPILAMERALQRNTPCILVHGLGGVGKTTLASGFLRWLDETGGLEGALWFDFRDIRTAEYVLNRTGEAFYGENFGAQTNKLDMLANALREHRVLMVWDNFESAAENLTGDDRDELGRFLDSICGTLGKVIMTSRSEEEWLGTARRFDLILSGLEGEERWEYCEIILRELGLKVDRGDPALNELMNQLAGHPLAMRVVLPKLEHMPAAKVSEALRTNIAELGLSEHEEQGRLFATLRFVEQGLPKHLRPMMGLVGLHEAYLDTDHLEAMAKQVDSDWTRQRIDQLVGALANAGLVRDLGSDIYESHPLLTSYLRSRGGAPEACQRAFVDVMSTLAKQLAPLQHREQGVPFLLYGASFHSALHLSKRLAMEQEFAVLAQSLAAYAQNSGSFVEASRSFTDLAQHHAARANWRGEGVAYHQLGMIAQEQRDFTAAREWYLKSLAVSENQSNLNYAAATYHCLGIIAQEQRDFAAAREWYLKSLAIFEKQGDYLVFAAKTYHELGTLAKEQRDFTTAREWHLKSLDISEKQGHLDVAARTYHELGTLAKEQRDFATASESYLKSLGISEKRGDLYAAANTYHQLGMIAQERQDFGNAREWYLKSLAIKEQRRDMQGAATTYHQLGMVAQELRDFATAREWYRKSLAISEKQRPHLAAGTYGQLGILAAMQGNVEEGGRWFARSIAGFQQTHDQHLVKHMVGNFLIAYGQASPGEKEKLKAVWLEAGLGPFPDTTASEARYKPLAGQIDNVGQGIADATMESIRTGDQHRPPRRQIIDVQVSVPSARSVGDSERLIQENLERQRRRGECAHHLAEWEKLPLWKRLSSPRPKAPE